VKIKNREMGFDFSKLNTIPPQPPVQETQAEEIHSEQPEIVTPQGTTAEPQTTQVETPPQPEIKVDSFIENLNKEFGTQYKSRDEIKNVFSLPKKVTEYETKLKESEGLSKSIEDYKKKIEVIEEETTARYLKSPLMQKAFVAQQLLEKYPDKDANVLQEIVMADVDKMGDLDAVAKERKIKYPSLNLADIKAVILSDLGVDTETKPEDWDSLAKSKLTMMAGDARENIKKLTQGIEFPKIVTQEERRKQAEEEQSKKIEILAPLKESFSKFDKFSHEGFDFDVPNDYQSKLPDMFDSMFIKAGMEPTQENLQSAVELRDALFLLQYFPKIREVIAKEAETKLQAKHDAELNNTQPPNTATMTDQENVKTLSGANQFLSDLKSR
jgi:hypothetical protein